MADTESAGAQVAEEKTALQNAIDTLKSTPCETLYALYRTYLNLLKKMLKYPRRLLRRITHMLMYPFNRAAKMLNSYVNMLKKLTFDFLKLTPSDLAKILKDMLKCPFIQMLMGSLIEKALDSIRKGKAALKKIFNTIKQAIVGRMKELLTKFKSIINNTITALDKKYEDLLKSLGVMSILQTLADIQKCIKVYCATYKALKPYMPDDPVSWEDALGVITNKDGKVTVAISGMVQRKVTGLKNGALTIAGKVSDDVSKAYDDAKRALEEFQEKPVQVPEPGKK